MNLAKCAATGLLVSACITQNSLAAHLAHDAKHFLDAISGEQRFSVDVSFEHPRHDHPPHFPADNSQPKTFGIVASTSDLGAYFVTSTQSFKGRSS